VKESPIDMQREKAAQGEGNDTLKVQWMKIAVVVSVYWLISFSMVFLNKYLLSSEDLKVSLQPLPAAAYASTRIVF